MNNNRLLIAIVVLAVLGGVLASQLRSHQSSSSVAKPTVTLPKIKRDDITKVEIDNPEKKLKVTLVKQGSAWALSAPLVAKADTAAAEAALDKLSDLEVAAIAASRKENHTRLGVDPAHGLHVKAFAGDKLLLDAYLGEAKSSGTMLRLEGQDVVVATRGSIRYAFEKELRYLRDRTITELDPATLKALSLVSAKGSFKFEKPDAKWVQAKAEKPIKDFADSKVESLASSFAKLRATDFAEPGATAESTGLSAPQATLVLTPKEGAEIKVELGKADPTNTDYFVRSSQSEVLFRISRYTGDRLIADAAAFSEPPKKPGEEQAANANKGMPVGGGGSLPPEILKQLQQQGMMGGH